MSYDRRHFLSALPGFAAAPTAAAAPLPQRESLEGDLLAAIREIPLVNTHEHIIPEEQRVASHVDFFTLASHYAISDVSSAGLSRDDLKIVRDENAPARRRWQAFEPHWRNARFTGYGQALRIAIRDLYGVDELSGETLGTINDRIRAKNKPGLYEDGWVFT